MSYGVGRPLTLGAFQLSNNVMLAPMAGVSDLPWRNLCRAWGAGYAVGEMLHSRQDLMGTQKSRTRIVQAQEQAPVAVQLLGNDPAVMAQAAKLQVAAGADVIDINMGCPAKKVCQQAAGSALLSNEGLVADILHAVVVAVPDTPVTLKIRTGISPEHKNAITIARIAQDAGVAMLTVHGRTRTDRFMGAAEYDTIAAVASAVAIPVIANGDIDSPEKAALVLAQTGAAGVMIGRAACGRPWLFGQVTHYLATGVLLDEPDLSTCWQVVWDHVGALHDFYGDVLGVRMARKHLAWYADRLDWGLETRRHLMAAETPAQQLNYLHDLR